MFDESTLVGDLIFHPSNWHMGLRLRSTEQSDKWRELIAYEFSLIARYAPEDIDQIITTHIESNDIDSELELVALALLRDPAFRESIPLDQTGGLTGAEFHVHGFINPEEFHIDLVTELAKIMVGFNNIPEVAPYSISTFSRLLKEGNLANASRSLYTSVTPTQTGSIPTSTSQTTHTSRRWPFRRTR